MQTTSKQIFIEQEQISAEDFLYITTGLFSAIILLFDLTTNKLQYTSEKLSFELGYEEKDFTAHNFLFTDLIHPDDAEEFGIILSHLAKKTEFIPEVNIRLLHKNGRYINYKLKTRTKSEMRYALVIITNEHAANEKTDELSELKRTRAEMIDELQRSNKELEEFAYVASHDLQEPLRKISTFCGRLSDKFSEVLNEEGNLYIDRILASAANMRILIDNLLEFSRITRVKHPKVETNLNFILHQVKMDLELNIEETKTRITSTDLPVVHASVSQMKQLFSNIIANAIKFCRADEEPQINISSGVLNEKEKAKLKLPLSRSYHRICFFDNGIGFEDEYATRIFQIFQRLHGKSEYPGSGIGLAICKKIIDQHQGLIHAESIPGKGACFTVILPERMS